MTPVLLALGLAVAAPLPRERPPKEPPIIGEWLRVGHTEAGAPVAPDSEPHHQVFKADGTWEYSYGGRRTAGLMTFVTDPRKSPPAIDIYMNRTTGDGWHGIYKVDGDTLTICLVRNGDRPRAFESTPDRPTTIWVFKRVKATD
jgi:uncharacterized protein (TIGR03067 family)